MISLCTSYGSRKYQVIMATGYGILSDTKKRRRYDMEGRLAFAEELSLGGKLLEAGVVTFPAPPINKEFLLHLAATLLLRN